MSCHSRPTWGIWRKWPMTQRLEKPASAAAPAGPVEAQGVHHGGQSSGAAALEHEVEHVEGVLPGPLVVGAVAHQGPQGVGVDHLVGAEVGRGPRRLAGTGWAYENHQAGC